MHRILLTALLTCVYILAGLDLHAQDQLYKVTAKELNVRAEANVTSSVVAKIKSGEVVTVVDQEGEWMKATLTNGVTGYLSAKHLTPASYASASTNIGRPTSGQRFWKGFTKPFVALWFISGFIITLMIRKKDGRFTSGYNPKSYASAGGIALVPTAFICGLLGLIYAIFF